LSNSLHISNLPVEAHCEMVTEKTNDRIPYIIKGISDELLV